jgi:hypothetical protein
VGTINKTGSVDLIFLVSRRKPLYTLLMKVKLKAIILLRTEDSVMTKLDSTKWGANTEILTTQYTGSVRPHMAHASNT